MYPPQSPIVPLVPGDDWSETITVTDNAGNAVDLTGWTITLFDVRWPRGAIALTADLTQASEGTIGFAASDSETAALPEGLLSTLTLKMRSPTGADETLFLAGVKGTREPADSAATTELHGVQGPPGKSFHVAEHPDDLTAALGENGDRAIIRSTGAEHRKDVGAWAPTGDNFWGTLLDQARSAQAAAESAANVAGQHVAELAAAAADPVLPAASASYAALRPIDVVIDASDGPWRDRLGPHLSWWQEPGQASGPWLGELSDEAAARAQPGAEAGAYYLSSADGNFYQLSELSGQTPVTRGRRHSLPAVRFIVAEANRVIIFDGDDPSYPMWMVMEAGDACPLPLNAAITSTAATHGLIAVGTAPGAGLITMDLASDQIAGRREDRTGYGVTAIVGRNKPAPDRVHFWKAGLTSANVSDVAVHVLRAAPIDPVAAVPRPAIAVATASGPFTGSLLMAIGEVFNLGEAGGHAGKQAALDDEQGLHLVRSDGAIMQWRHPHDIETDGTTPDAVYSEISAPSMCGTVQDIAGNAFASPKGLTLLKSNPSAPEKAMTAYITADYTTGWMIGDTVFAGLADTALDALAGGTDTDRSPAQNHATITGTIHRQPVVQGGELAAYGGFSFENRMQATLPGVRLNDSLGLHLSLWVMVETNASSIVAGLNTDNVFIDGPDRFGVTIGWTPHRFVERGSNIGDQLPGTFRLNTWHKVDTVSDHGQTRLYVDGQLMASGPFSYAINNDPVLSIGGASGGSGALQGRISLVRLSQTVPSDHQVAFAYRTEQPLLAEGAPATLAGAVNSIDHIACDAASSTLHVSTSAARSTFAGLVRTGLSSEGNVLAAYEGRTISDDTVS